MAKLKKEPMKNIKGWSETRPVPAVVVRNSKNAATQSFIMTIIDT